LPLVIEHAAVRGKDRPRTVTRGGRTWTYTPHATKDYEDDIGWLAKMQMLDREKLTGPLKVTITAFIRVPASWPRRQRDDAAAKGWATCKPDCDNIGKSCLDAIAGIVYDDDAAVAQLIINKVYVLSDNLVRIEIEQI
jgi:Holliday junction resolvase RusA-like endonuclease